MPTYVAHYSSPSGSAAREKGLFEFESEARAGSKGNIHDARVRMLELFGKDAVSWSIVKVEQRRATAGNDGQLELDFRAPKEEPKRAQKKQYW